MEAQSKGDYGGFGGGGEEDFGPRAGAKEARK
jgi:hypothetical protein